MLAALIEALRDVSTIPAGITLISALNRDRSDDYLLAYAIEYDVDVLVTGDPDLLVLGGIDGLRIMKPSEFLDELEKHPRSRSKN